MSDYLTRKQAADMLNLTRQRIEQLISSGKLTETADGIPLAQVQARKIAATLPVDAPTVLVQAVLPTNAGNWYRAEETRAKTVLMDAYLCRDVTRQETAEEIERLEKSHDQTTS